MRWSGRNWLLRSLVVLSLAGLGGALTAGGCGGRPEEPCGMPWNLCFIDNEDGTSNGVCAGRCVIQPKLGFYNPSLVWIGDPDEPEPACEDLMGIDLQLGTVDHIAPTLAFKFRSVRPDEEPCPACGCEVPSCFMPEMVAAHSHASCESTPAETLRPFNPPRLWRGECASPGIVPPEQFSAIWVAAAPDGACAPFTLDDPTPKEPFKVGVACSGVVAELYCPTVGEVCMINQQQANVPPGWRYCMVGDGGDRECYPPAGPGERPTFSDKFIFYDRDLEASCDPCICLPPSPARECTARVSAYSDRACSESALLGTKEVTAGGSSRCLQPEDGSALGSIRAEWEVNEPGFCLPAGGKSRPVTVCCLPEPAG